MSPRSSARPGCGATRTLEKIVSYVEHALLVRVRWGCLCVLRAGTPTRLVVVFQAVKRLIRTRGRRETLEFPAPVIDGYAAAAAASAQHRYRLHKEMRALLFVAIAEASSYLWTEARPGFWHEAMHLVERQDGIVRAAVHLDDVGVAK